MTKSLIPIVAITGTLVIVGGLYGFNLLPKPSSIDINQITGESGEVTLALTPSTVNATKDAETTFTLTANAGTSKLVVLSVELTYDSGKVSTPVVTQGSFLANVLSSPKVENGKITFSFAAAPDSGGAAGSGTIATIALKPTAYGTSALSFTAGTSATAISSAGERIPTNTLRSAADATITVGAPASSPTPTPTITPSPTPSPTKTPSPTPTKNNVLVVTNTPKPTLRPTSTPTPDYNSSYTPSTPSQSDDFIPITDDPEGSVTDSRSQEEPSLFQKVKIGWSIIFQYLFNLLGLN